MFGFRIQVFLFFGLITHVSMGQSLENEKIKIKTPQHIWSLGLVYWEDKVGLLDSQGTGRDAVINAKGYELGYSLKFHKKINYNLGASAILGVGSSGVSDFRVNYFQADVPIYLIGIHGGIDLWRNESAFLNLLGRYSYRILSADKPSEEAELFDDKKSYFGLGLEGSLYLSNKILFSTAITKNFGLDSIMWALALKFLY